MRKKRLPSLVLVLLAATLIAGGYEIGRRTAPASAATGPSVPTKVAFSAFYLDVGASSSLGFQPTGIANHNGRRTDTGYANDLLLIERYHGIDLSLDQVGCPGETVQSFLSTTEADSCYALPATQLRTALTYLRANTSSPGLVTIDLGFNNINMCFPAGVINTACVNQAVSVVGADMPKIVSQLKAAAGPRVRFVGLDYYDPFLASYIDGASGSSEATASLYAIDRLNATLVSAFDRAHVAVANVPGVFKMDNTALANVANVGRIPANVQAACEFTWMCDPKPFGPDDHPNEAGYALIAQAIAATLPKSW